VRSPQTLSEAERRQVAAWAADCAERVLGLFEAAYAVKAASLAASSRPEVVDEEIRWQLIHMTAEVRTALRALPPVGENSAGPLGPGLLASGQLCTIIRKLQSGLTAPDPD
jgi:hypothetical protein